MGFLAWFLPKIFTFTTIINNFQKNNWRDILIIVILHHTCGTIIILLGIQSHVYLFFMLHFYAPSIELWSPMSTKVQKSIGYNTFNTNNHVWLDISFHYLLLLYSLRFTVLHGMHNSSMYSWTMVSLSLLVT